MSNKIVSNNQSGQLTPEFVFCKCIEISSNVHTLPKLKFSEVNRKNYVPATKHIQLFNILICT